MAKITVPMTKTVVNTVKNGEMIIELKGDTYHLEYHNHLYKNSPFKVPTSFSNSFSINQILKSHEVITFMNRFN